MVEKVLFKKSPDSGSTENSPKYPEHLEYGEIAINYGAGHEGLIIQNDKNELLLFSPDEKIMNYISSKEFVVSEALNELNDKILTVSGEVETKQEKLVSGTNIKTINNQSILGNGNITIEGSGQSYTAGKNIDISSSNVISVTGITVPTKVSDLTNDIGYITTANTKNFITSGQAQTQINTSLNGYATEQWVTNKNYLTEHQSLAGLVASAEYVSTDKKIIFKDKSGTTISSFIDATDFIKDGMVNTVAINNGNLVITFNTDAGKEDISIPLTDIFNPSNYYTKTEIDNKGYLTEHQSLANYYTSAQTDTKIANAIASETARTESTYLKEHQSLDNYYTSAQTDTKIATATNDMATKTWVGQQGYLTAFTETQLSKGTTEGTGNVVTEIAVDNHKITLTKGITIPNWATATTKPTYTASEVGALPTGTTLDNIADGTTRKLSNYALASDLTTLSSSTVSVENTLTAHTGNTNIHVTSAQKTNWNTAYNNRITGVTVNSGTTNSGSITNNVLSLTVNTLPSYNPSTDEGKVLIISGGTLAFVSPTAIYSGTNAPDNNMGNNGDIYLQTS